MKNILVIGSGLSGIGACKLAKSKGHDVMLTDSKKINSKVKDFLNSMNILFEEETPLKLIEKIKPNFLVKGGDYSLEDIVGAEFVENNGGQVKIVKLLEGHSSSSLIDKFVN